MLNKAPQWQILQTHRAALENIHMKDLFAEDTERFERFSVSHEGLLLDYSKHRITVETVGVLHDLARYCKLEEKRDALFSGSPVNKSENRAVQHFALRRPRGDSVILNGQNIVPIVHHTLERMKKCAEEIRNGHWTGHSGKPITTIVNIAIGGSDTGTRLCYEALKTKQKNVVAVRFVSNVDGAHIEDMLHGCDPETTLFIVASKSFTTQETLENAKTAKSWLTGQLGEEAVARHFIAISNNVQAIHNFGISKENTFPLPDWVGGRFSLWSSIGLAFAIGIGFEDFRSLLDGAYSMDTHFQKAPLEKNIPVILGLLGIWYNNFWQRQSQAVVPYSYALRSLPQFLQQLQMESNGKNITIDNKFVDYPTDGTIFGIQGTDAQHSFFQLLHQGTDFIPCDFIGIIEPLSRHTGHHEKLLVNMLSQSRALMEGRENRKEPYRHFTGNRPSSTILLERLDAYHLGMLLALYEHKVFVQGVLWDINSFDQWGVELGKIMAHEISSGAKEEDFDSSTQGLLKKIKSVR